MLGARIIVSMSSLHASLHSHGKVASTAANQSSASGSGMLRPVTDIRILVAQTWGIWGEGGEEMEGIKEYCRKKWICR